MLLGQRKSTARTNPLLFHDAPLLAQSHFLIGLGNFRTEKTEILDFNLAQQVCNPA
jgi:hypothetical protein